tara:strand:- start:12 stop:113 length:102 start_codon:yes stop_codon:yes gene_type:complete
MLEYSLKIFMLAAQVISDDCLLHVQRIIGASRY